jgi:hypothetical protein
MLGPNNIKPFTNVNFNVCNELHCLSIAGFEGKAKSLTQNGTPKRCFIVHEITVSNIGFTSEIVVDLLPVVLTQKQ